MAVIRHARLPVPHLQHPERALRRRAPALQPAQQRGRHALRPGRRAGRRQIADGAGPAAPGRAAFIALRPARTHLVDPALLPRIQVQLPHHGSQALQRRGAKQLQARCPAGAATQRAQRARWRAGTGGRGRQGGAGGAGQLRVAGDVSHEGELRGGGGDSAMGAGGARGTQGNGEKWAPALLVRLQQAVLAGKAASCARRPPAIDRRWAGAGQAAPSRVCRLRSPPAPAPGAAAPPAQAAGWWGCQGPPLAGGAHRCNHCLAGRGAREAQGQHTSGASASLQAAAAVAAAAAAVAVGPHPVGSATHRCDRLLGR